MTNLAMGMAPLRTSSFTADRYVWMRSTTVSRSSPDNICFSTKLGTHIAVSHPMALLQERPRTHSLGNIVRKLAPVASHQIQPLCLERGFQRALALLHNQRRVLLLLQ